MPHSDELWAFSCAWFGNDRERWAEIMTARGDVTRFSFLSWPAAIKYLPRLCDRHGIAPEDRDGLFSGRVFFLRPDGQGLR